MFNYQIFEEVFAFDTECFYDKDTVMQTTENRKVLEPLFIDRVMKMLGIVRPSKNYPPIDNSSLRTLHKQIVESSGADHHKLSVLYYILITFDYPTGKRDYQAELQRQSSLPENYAIYMKGLWHLDRQEFDLAIQYLTHPSLIPTFADEILETLVRRSRGDLTLALAYYHTAQPTLSSRASIECLFSAIARTSVTEALYFSRGQPEFAHRHMFELLVSLVLNNSSKDTIADRSVELVSLPLTREEDGWLEDYIMRGEGRLLKKSKDTLMMRRIGTGDFAGSLSMRGVNNRSIGGLDWSTLSQAIQDGLGPRVDG
ncbi:hypothetical protein MBM_06790 [Drepanopeziza brunnea f. sp. 'multigermtubi' MB_m1]|uniref:ELYS-like domain-containing protein n=1 Tax=Marssonina brunnea f. sp. multigermtubi (strain MB_m1) TaxID=1072389 RepID=K1XQZ7_MARBU|nr:uncharacterized protein MBM_06790 [Drepanopeziza brunnea f. sp. 'multigermtubi' MB_m1]EKD15029.1 hypothetical protein MBM_06790 [Drepanopeziza brunnea f. sp. 'multigermtubi' MB_m1]